MTVYKRLAITTGEPAGIGAEILVKAAQQTFSAELVVFGDPDLLLTAAKNNDLPLTLYPFNPNFIRAHQPGTLSIVPIKEDIASKLGHPKKESANYVMRCLDQATEACITQHCHGLVTGPINKNTIIEGLSPNFIGHTEYLAKRTNTETVVMMLSSAQLRVALVTTHLALRKVPAAITHANLTRVLSIIHHSLDHPRIAVCGLNPHAGESGHFGTEEETCLKPVIACLQQQGITISGPWPADTLFTAEHRKQYDVIVAMYHDQGLAPFKALSFGESCNVTLGLPFLRTSVDHGTACDIAGKNQANAGSLCYAILEHLK